MHTTYEADGSTHTMDCECEFCEAVREDEWLYECVNCGLVFQTEEEITEHLGLHH